MRASIARNLLFHLRRRIHWRAGLGRGKGGSLSSSEARNKVLGAIPKASCVDMESAAIAQVCRAADLPLGVLRVISDSADGSAHIDFAKFVEQSASKACAETVRHALRALAQ